MRRDRSSSSRPRTTRGRNERSAKKPGTGGPRSRSYGKKEDFPDRRPPGDKPDFKKSYSRSGDRPFKPRPESAGDEGRKRPFDRSTGDKPEFKKSYSRSGDRPFKPRTESAGDEGRKRSSDRSTGDKPDFKKPYTRSGDRPFKPRTESAGDEGRKRPFDRSTGDKPDFKKPYVRSGDRPFKPRSESAGDEGRKRSFDRSPGEKPAFRGKRTSGERSDFKRPIRSQGDRPVARPGDSERVSRDQPPRYQDQGGKPSRFSKPVGENKWNRKEGHEFYGDKKKSNYKKRESFSKSSGNPEDEGTRLNKFIANAGICSRREADDLINAGVIKVNGEVITTLGYKLKPGDEVRYNGEILRGEKLVYILLNKPKDFITTTDDPEDRKTVMGLIANACKERVYPVGRLDRNTTGLLLITNDGDLAKKLTHPKFEVHKIYQVELDKSLAATDMAEIEKGIYLNDGMAKVDDIAYMQGEKSIVGVEIHSGRNRIVRRIFEHLGYAVKKLDRVVFAGLTKKDLPRGRWRFLTPLEIASLKMMTGSKKPVLVDRE